MNIYYYYINYERKYTRHHFMTQHHITTVQ